MSLTLQVKLFNTPTVLENNRKVVFPLRKSEALFYYLVVCKEATRDELATLLWGEHDESSAKKYLRNTLYRLNLVFGQEIVISPQRHILMLNPKIKIESDLEVFLTGGIPGTAAYSGEFLQGFIVKDAENFTQWTRTQVEYFRESYVAKLYNYIEENADKPDEKNIEHYARLLIRIDEFDERAYRILMKIYADKGAYNKAINIYNLLVEILEKELGITPEAKTRDMYIMILERRNSTEPEVSPVQGDFFFGRQAELQTLLKEYHRFTHGKDVCSFVLSGEAGIGKTKLKEEFLKGIQRQDIYLLETYCYQAEEGYLLKPWNTVFSRVYDIIEKDHIDIPRFWQNIIAYIFPYFAPQQVERYANPVEIADTLKAKVIEDAIISVLRKISLKKKILLIVEDLQWIDRMSLSLLRNILTHSDHLDIFLVATLRDGGGEEIDKFITLMSRYHRLKALEIARFNQEEVEAFITKALPGYEFPPQLRKRIYKETEGNPFFILEILNIIREKGNIDMMTSRMQDILKSRVIDISDEGKKILNICSLFFDEITLDMLQRVSGKNEFKLIDVMEELKNKSILKEITDSHKISYRFTHQKLREFIYTQQSLGRRRILHHKIALILERELQNDKRDILVYPHLIYHYSNARNWTASLQYSIKHANYYFDFSHELYPEFSHTNTKGDKYLQITREVADKYINDIESLLEKAKSREIFTDEVARLEVSFLHLKGRYLIREGEYQKGVAYIKKVIRNSLQTGDYKYAIKGLIQMVFYAIQTHRVEIMEENLQSALELARTQKARKDTGTLLRLKGLNMIMSCRYREAEKMLNGSIKIFSRLDKEEGRYSLCIAAAYNYLGEIRRHTKNFPEAIEYYKKAITVGKDRRAFSSMAIFYCNAGQAAFENNDFPGASRYFADAISMYRKFDTLWGRSTAEGYRALLLVQEGKYKEALKGLENADDCAEKIKSPYELGLIYRIKAEIKAQMQHNPVLNEVFSAYLPQGVVEYCDRGIELLKGIKECYEIDRLIQLKVSAALPS